MPMNQQPASSSSPESGDLNRITGAVVDAALRVHTSLGPGLLESAYRECLAHELTSRGHHIVQEFPVPLISKGVHLAMGYRLDLLVDDKVIVEVKATDGIHPIHVAQTLTYLKLKERPVGLILNFNTVHLKDGIRRVISSKGFSARSSESSGSSVVR